MKKELEKFIEWLKESLPKLYYPNGKYEIITKSELVEWFS